MNKSKLFKWCHKLTKEFTINYGGRYQINFGQFIKLGYLIKAGKENIKEVEKLVKKEKAKIIEFKPKETNPLNYDHEHLDTALEIGYKLLADIKKSNKKIEELEKRIKERGINYEEL